jgi:hypothetical protein
VADVQEAINQVNYVCNEKRLLLNPEKTMYLEFHSSRKNIDNSMLFRVNNKSVQRVDFAKLLGVFIDDQLNWNIHVNYVSGRLSSSIFVLYSLREKISEDILLLSFFSYVYNLFYNGIMFWGSHVDHLSRVFKLQKKALRTIKRMRPTDSCIELFQKHKILTVPCIYILVAIMHRKFNPEEYILNENIHPYNTRNKTKVAVESHSSNIVEKSPHYCSAKLYDFLPQNIRNVTNRDLFKILLKKILLKKSYYNVTMFYNKDTMITQADVLKLISKKDLDKNSISFKN